MNEFDIDFFSFKKKAFNINTYFKIPRVSMYMFFEAGKKIESFYRLFCFERNLRTGLRISLGGEFLCYIIFSVSFSFLFYFKRNLRTCLRISLGGEFVTVKITIFFSVFLGLGDRFFMLYYF